MPREKCIAIGSRRDLIHFLLGNPSAAHAIEAYRDSGEARCAKSPHHKACPFWPLYTRAPGRAVRLLFKVHGRDARSSGSASWNLDCGVWKRTTHGRGGRTPCTATRRVANHLSRIRVGKGLIEQDHHCSLYHIDSRKSQRAARTRLKSSLASTVNHLRPC